LVEAGSTDKATAKTNRDKIITFASAEAKKRDSKFDLKNFNIVVLYVLGDSASSALYDSADEFNGSVSTDKNDVHVFKGVNVFVNSPIYKRVS